MGFDPPEGHLDRALWAGNRIFFFEGVGTLNSKEDVSFLPARQQAGGTVKNPCPSDDLSSVQGHAADISDTCRRHGALVLKSTIVFIGQNEMHLILISSLKDSSK